MLLSTGYHWLATPIRPMVAKTEVRPSSSGMPAATSAPKAISRMSSVTGSESSPAFARSWPKTSLICLSMDASPTSLSVTAGCAFWSAAVVANSAGTCSSALTRSFVRSLKVTIAEWRSREICPSLPGAYGESTDLT